MRPLHGHRPPSGQLRVSLPAGGSVLLHRRGLLVGAVLVAAALAVAVIALLTGTYELSAAEAVGVLRGEGSGLDRFIVWNQRLPRALAALLVGALLAVSGAVFQSLSRNPLGSPDIVGFTTGASTGGLLVILLGASSSTTSIAMGATIGGFATAAVVVLVALRRGGGGEAGEPLVLAGVALAEMLAALNDYLLSRATIESAEVAKAWQFGSLNAISWGQVTPLIVGAALLLPFIALLSRPAGALEMGDATAAGLGLSVGRVRGALLGYGVILASVCVAVAGPIGFLALAAPQLAGRLCRSSGISMATSAGWRCCPSRQRRA